MQKEIVFEELLKELTTYQYSLRLDLYSEEPYFSNSQERYIAVSETINALAMIELGISGWCQRKDCGCQPEVAIRKLLKKEYFYQVDIDMIEEYLSQKTKEEE